jgi:hypothetical protein
VEHHLEKWKLPPTKPRGVQPVSAP